MRKTTIVFISSLFVAAPAFSADWNVANVHCDATAKYASADGKTIVSKVITAEVFSLESMGGIDLLMMSPLRAATALHGSYRAQKTFAIENTDLSVKITTTFTAPAMNNEGLSAFASIRRARAGQSDEILTVGGATTPWRDAAVTSLSVQYTAFSTAFQQLVVDGLANSEDDAATKGLLAVNAFVDLDLSCAIEKDATEAPQRAGGIQLF